MINKNQWYLNKWHYGHFIWHENYCTLLAAISSVFLGIALLIKYISVNWKNAQYLIMSLENKADVKRSRVLLLKWFHTNTETEKGEYSRLWMGNLTMCFISISYTYDNKFDLLARKKWYIRPVKLVKRMVLIVWCKLHKKQHVSAFFGKSVLKCHLT